MEWFELGLKAQIFKDKFGKVLGKNDNLMFAFPFNEYQIIVRRVSRKRIKNDVAKRLQQEEELKHLLQQQFDPRSPILKQFDLRPLNLRKPIIPKKPVISYPKPTPPLPEPIRTKLNEENPKWLQKYLDKDAEKPDKERRHT